MIVKKAQGLQISTIILAVLGLIVLVILIGLVTGKINLFSKNLNDAKSQPCASATAEEKYADECTTEIIYGNFDKMPAGMVCCKKKS